MALSGLLLKDYDSGWDQLLDLWQRDAGHYISFRGLEARAKGYTNLNIDRLRSQGLRILYNN
jgi:hypothetical protein